MQPDHETQLIRRAATDPAAFSALYEYYFPKIYGYVMYHIGDQQDAEDIVSNIFTRVLEGIGGFDNRGDGAFAAWLFRIAGNAITSLYRQRTRKPMLSLIDDIAVSTEREPDSQIVHQEQALLLHQWVKSLPKQRREVISLKFFGGLRNKEIAAVLGLNERTVASHLCRGIDDLRAKYMQNAAGERGDYE